MNKYVTGLVLCVLTVTACKKNTFHSTTRSRTASSSPYTDTVVLPPVIAEDMFLSNETLWLLDGKTYVANNAWLIIQEGTRIEAIKQRTAFDASALIVTRNSHLFAVGTAEWPIVFTSHEPNPQPGDWAGIILLGNAPVNKQRDTCLQRTRKPGAQQWAKGFVEPVNGEPVFVDLFYGGGSFGMGDDTHATGELQYVRIQYGGAIGEKNERAALTCAGVGNGTVISYVNVDYPQQDAFAFLGGRVSADHLFARLAGDDAFAFDEGYQGALQFLLSTHNPTFVPAGTFDRPCAVEVWSGDLGSYPDFLHTKPTISNLTSIGVENAQQGSNLFSGIWCYFESQCVIRHSIVTGFPVGVSLDATTFGTANAISNNILHGFTTAGPSFLPASNYKVASSNFYNPDFVAPFGGLWADYRVMPFSTALSLGTDFTGLPVSFTPTNYRGALGDNSSDNWLAGWTSF